MQKSYFLGPITNSLSWHAGFLLCFTSIIHASRSASVEMPSEWWQASENNIKLFLSLSSLWVVIFSLLIYGLIRLCLAQIKLHKKQIEERAHGGWPPSTWAEPKSGKHSASFPGWPGPSRAIALKRTARRMRPAGRKLVFTWVLHRADYT